MAVVFLALLLAGALASDVPVNMNGEYLIANPNSASGATFNTQYSSRGAEYFDVYSPPITTVYAEVFW